MAGFLVVPDANADDDLTGAVLDNIATTPQTITGLTNGTAYIAYAISDASATFTPSAGGGSTTWVDGLRMTGSNTTSFNETGLSFGTASADRHILLALAYVQNGGTPTLTVTIGGVTATLVTGSLATQGGLYGVQLFSANVPTGATGTIDVQSTVACFHMSIGWWWTDFTPTFGTPVTATVSSTTVDLDLNTATGGDIIGVVNSAEYDVPTETPTFTGVTEQEAVEYQTSNNETAVFISDAIVTGETPRDVSVVFPTSGNNSAVIVSVT